ncbi:MAG: HlyD family efflux transporter periplasmic adaptor subunit [Peptostreptococcales bacterium]
MDIQKRKQIISISLIIVVVVAGLYFAIKALAGDRSASGSEPLYSTVEVARGDIAVGVRSKGQLQPTYGGEIQVPGNYFYDMPSVNFTISEILVKEGDAVSEGQLLIRLASSNLESTLKSKEEELDSLREQLSEMTGKPKNEVEYINPAKGVVLTSPIDGRIMDLKANIGDTLKVGDIVSSVVDDSQFRIKAHLTAGEVVSVKVGDILGLKFVYFEGSMNGTITDISRSAIPSSKNVSGGTGTVSGFVYPVYLVADNPGLIQPDMELRVGNLSDDGSIQLFGNLATVDGFMKEDKIINKVEAIVTDVHVYDYQEVKKGDPIISLSGEKMQETITQKIEQIKMLQRNIDQLREQFNNLEVRSSITGIISYLDAKVGNNAMPGHWLGSIYNTGKMRLWIQVDDIDIINVVQGAPVNVTVDAMPNQVFEGTVMNVSSRGTQAGSIVKYDVNIDVVGGEGLMPGMQATAYIDAGSASDVLLIPVEALFEENGVEMVEVLEDGVAVTKNVTLGLTNDRFAEVVEGLEEGELVITGSSKDALPSEHIKSNDSLLPTPPSNDEPPASQEEAQPMN